MGSIEERPSLIVAPRVRIHVCGELLISPESAIRHTQAISFYLPRGPIGSGHFSQCRQARAESSRKEKTHRFSGAGVLRHRPAGISLARLCSRRPVYPAADEAPQSPLLRGSAVGRRVSRRGASAPQEFQVFLAKNRRPIQCGMVRVAFIARKNIKDVPVQSFNTPRGTVLVSSPEATALDLAPASRSGQDAARGSAKGS
jgi:hypothetical protein